MLYGNFVTYDNYMYIFYCVDVPQPLALRLSGSSVAWAGNVEVDVLGNNRIWGSVCGNGWSLDDATVVCRQLGYSKAIGAMVYPIFGQS